jgi:preprotein translocase subunit YajC
MTGIAVIIIILVPIAFQVFMLQIRQDKRHKEIKEILNRIEIKLEKETKNDKQK